MTTPEHLNRHERETLARSSRTPRGHNIEWHLVLTLLDAVATVEETHEVHMMVRSGTRPKPSSHVIRTSTPSRGPTCAACLLKKVR